MKKQLLLVSINIPTYNSARTLRETLQSIKDQSYKHIEIIVADGHSRDTSVAIAKSFGAMVLYEERLADARYACFTHSRGKYILILDSDQVLHPEVISRCVKLCEDGRHGAVTISERSIISTGSLVEKLMAYDKWVVDQNRDADAVFGTALPRFFKREILSSIRWPRNLIVFDHTYIYMELIRRGVKVAYLDDAFISHHEVTDWASFVRKFYRYGSGYVEALRGQPGPIAAHSLPRRSYFTKAAFTKPHYFLGLLLLYAVKVAAAGVGVASSMLGELRKTLVTMGDWAYYSALDRYLRDAESVLDVGCGSSSPIAKVPKHFYAVGVDAFGPSIEKSKQQGIHDAYKKADVLAVDKLFKKKQFDAVIALDLIEHLEKKQGFELIKKMSSLAKKKIIIMTPNGFYKQDPYDGNKWQVHHSGWSVDDFVKLGFTVRGIRGVKWLRGEYATLKWKPWIFWGIVSVFSEPLVYFLPRMAYQLFAVKEIDI